MVAGHRRRPWSPDDDAILRRLKNEGRTASAVAAQLGRTVHATEARAFRLNLAAAGQRAWSEEENEMLRTVARQHAGAQEIAQQLQRTPPAVWQHARRLGISVGRPRKNRIPWRAQDDEQLDALASQGITKTAAARIMGRDHGTVRNHVLRLGLQWRNPEKAAREPLRKSFRPDPAALVERLRVLADNGWSVGMAALELDIRSQTASRWAKLHGIRWRVRGRSVRGGPGSTPSSSEAVVDDPGVIGREE
jgi:DNA-binding CsgD family transcriptional regulator